MTLDALFLKIEEAETCHDAALAYREAIIRLTDNEPAVCVLLNEYREATLDAVDMWRAIEQMPEFKAKYHDRDSARADFFRVAFANDKMLTAKKK